MKLNLIPAENISEFRKEHFSPSVVRKRLAKAYPNPLLYSVACGVGKTFCIQDFVNDEETWKHYDLIIVTTPQLKTLKELQAKINAPVSTVVLKGRPVEMCDDLNPQWEQLLRQGLNDLGKDLVCKICPKKPDCEWQKPLQKRLLDARLILTVDAMVTSHPTFFASLDRHIESLGLSHERTLVINDEGGIYAVPKTVHISKDLLRSQVELLKRIQHVDATAIIAVFSDLIKATSTEQLRAVDRRCLPLFAPQASLLQSICHKSGDLYALHLLRELRLCREQDLTLQGDTILACLRPLYGYPYFALGASVDSVACLHTSLHDDIHSPLSHFRVMHPETQFFKIGGRSSTKTFLQKNPQCVGRLCDKAFDYALFCYGRNKKVCFVLSKQVFPDFQKAFVKHQKQLGIEIFKTYDYTKHVEDSLTNIPVITYGAKGINNLENYDCVFAVMPYYVHPSSIIHAAFVGEIYCDENSVTHEFSDSDSRYKVTSPEHQYLQPAVDAFQDLLELDVVNQSVSRIRPFTQPREVVLCGGQDFGRFLGVPVACFDNEQKLFQHMGIPTHSTHFQHATRWTISQRLMEFPDDLIASEKLAELGLPDQKTSKYMGTHFVNHSQYWKPYFEASLGYFYRYQVKVEIDWDELLPTT